MPNWGWQVSNLFSAPDEKCFSRVVFEQVMYITAKGFSFVCCTFSWQSFSVVSGHEYLWNSSQAVKFIWYFKIACSYLNFFLNTGGEWLAFSDVDEWWVKILIPISSYRAEIWEHRESYNSVAVSKCKWDKLLLAISQLFTCLEPAKSILPK